MLTLLRSSIGGLLLLTGFASLPALADPPSPDASSPYAWTDATVDPDALAARLPRYQDLNRKTCTEALAAYANAHPTPELGAEQMKKLIRLTTYLWYGGNDLGENLWAINTQLANDAKQAGASDPFLDYAIDLTSTPSSPDECAQLEHRADVFAASAYPVVFKTLYYRTVMEARCNLRSSDQASQDDLTVFTNLIHKWGAVYQMQVASGLPVSILYNVGNNFMEGVKDDATLLPLVHDEIDRAVTASAPDSPLQVAFQGGFLINKAWIARSSGFANSVSSQQWAGFGDYLAQADKVLEAGYTKFPGTSEISNLMITVELGQGQGRDRMEQWYQRAVQADPLNDAPYRAKYWYLQPRWYGSGQDILAFWDQCRQSTTGPPEMPTFFFVAMSQAHDLDEGLYRDPTFWKPVESAYRAFPG